MYSSGWYGRYAEVAGHAEANRCIYYCALFTNPISVNEDDLAKLEKFRNDFGQDGWDSEF